MLFDLQITERGEWVVLAPIGEVDLSTAPRIRQEGVRAVAAGARHLVIDLGGVDFMDSLGVGVLVALRKRVASVGGSLRLARPEPQVRRVLSLAGADQVMDVVGSLDDAVAAPVLPLVVQAGGTGG